MKFKVWPLRFFIIIYMIYVMFISDNHLITHVKFEGQSNGTITGGILIRLVFLFFFILFFIYQIRQGIYEFKKVTEINKDKLRLYSVIFSLIFFSLFAIGILNIFKSELDLIENNLLVYTLFTSISIIVSIMVMIMDFELFKKSRKK